MEKPEHQTGNLYVSRTVMLKLSDANGG